MIKKKLQKKKIYNHYLDKQKDIIYSTRFKVEEVFDKIVSKDTISTEQITRLKTFFLENQSEYYFLYKDKFIQTQNEKQIDFEPSAPPECSNFQ